MLISFIKFRDMNHVAAFSVANAIPERENNQLGELPDGTPVWAEFTQEIEIDYSEVVRFDGYIDIEPVETVTLWVTAYVIPD